MALALELAKRCIHCVCVVKQAFSGFPHAWITEKMMKAGQDVFTVNLGAVEELCNNTALRLPAAKARGPVQTSLIRSRLGSCASK